MSVTAVARQVADMILNVRFRDACLSDGFEWEYRRTLKEVVLPGSRTTSK